MRFALLIDATLAQFPLPLTYAYFGDGLAVVTALALTGRRQFLLLAFNARTTQLQHSGAERDFGRSLALVASFAKRHFEKFNCLNAQTRLNLCYDAF